MSARVNLLPRESVERIRARRMVVGTGVAVVVYILLLGVLYMFKLAEVERVREQRDDEQAEVDRLQARVAELQQYRDLANELEARNGVLAAAMAAEIGWARVLNDLSLAFPGTSSLSSLSATAADPPVGTELGEQAGTLVFTGYSVERYAPGVESVLIEFDKVRAFFNPYLSSAAQAAIGVTEVTNFNGSVQLDDEAYTRRYEDGLPAEMVR
jgi:Tfp pilus assembly protein PilN